MKKIDLGQTVQILANVGVIAGIVVLAVEIHQNNEALNLQARQERAAVRREMMARQVDNPALVRATVKANQGEPLTPEDVHVLDRQNVYTLVNWVTIYAEVEDGVLSDRDIPLSAWRQGFHGDPLMQETWAERKANFSPVFVEWMEQNIIEPGPP